MGCDIHCYIEYKRADSDRWSDFGGRINPGRCYPLFARLAGVRNYHEVQPVSPARGLPADIAWSAGDDEWLYIGDAVESGSTTRELAERWVKDGCARYKINGDDDGPPKFVSNPDHHSHSWLTADEFAKAIEGFEEAEYIAILAALRSFEAQGCTARLVFWFDN